MVKRNAFPFRILSLILFLSSLFSSSDSSECEKIKEKNQQDSGNYFVNNPTNLTNNPINLGGCQEEIDQNKSEWEESEEVRFFYNRDYKLNRSSVYSDSDDPNYTPPPSRKKQTEQAKHVAAFFESYEGNLTDLAFVANPTDQQLENCFYLAFCQEKVYRSPRQGKMGNTYYIIKGCTPTKTPRREGNFGLINRGLLPVWVNPITNQIEALHCHHVTQSNRRCVIVVVPAWFHKKNSKFLHRRNKRGSQIKRGAFQAERSGVVRKLYF